MKALLIGCILPVLACKEKDIRTPDAEMLRIFDVDSAGDIKPKIDSLISSGFVRKVDIGLCPNSKEMSADAVGISDSTELICLRVEKERSLFYFIDIHANQYGPCATFVNLLNSKGFVLKWISIGANCKVPAVVGP